MRVDEVLVIDWFVPHLFCTDMLPHNLLCVVKKPLSGFAELHLRVKLGKICIDVMSHSLSMVA
jgi:hypothetical protein